MLSVNKSLKDIIDVPDELGHLDQWQIAYDPMRWYIHVNQFNEGYNLLFSHFFDIRASLKKQWIKYLA
jgi:hypothetical protein